MSVPPWVGVVLPDVMVARWWFRSGWISMGWCWRMGCALKDVGRWNKEDLATFGRVKKKWNCQKMHFKFWAFVKQLADSIKMTLPHNLYTNTLWSINTYMDFFQWFFSPQTLGTWSSWSSHLDVRPFAWSYLIVPRLGTPKWLRCEVMAAFMLLPYVAITSLVGLLLKVKMHVH